MRNTPGKSYHLHPDTLKALARANTDAWTYERRIWPEDRAKAYWLDLAIPRFPRRSDQRPTLPLNNEW